MTVLTRREAREALATGTPTRREGAGTGLLPKYPRGRGRRWLLRLALSLPFLVLTAILATGQSAYFFEQTANAERLADVGRLLDSPFEISLLAELYPPISSGLAIVIPGGVVGMAVFGSIAAGFFLQRIIEWILRQRMRRIVGFLLVAVVAGTPLFGYLVTTNLEATLGVILFGLGMIDLIRFIVFANTQAGFRVGLYFATAALSAPAFLFSVVIATSIAPFLAHSRRGARAANALVIAFPTFAAFGAVAILGLVFRGDPLFAISTGGFAFRADRIEQVASLFSQPWGWLYFVPSVAGIIVAFVLRRPVLAIATPLITASILFMSVLGITPDGSAGTAYLILAVIGIAVVARPLRQLQRVAVDILLVAQIAAAWGMSFLLYPSVVTWMQAVAEGVVR